MQEIKEKCLNENISHVFHYVNSESGQMNWICALCGTWTQELEDSQP